jgi:hypothetical protein
VKTKDQFIEWLREKILQNQAEPPANTWQEIADELDLEESWAEINDELDLDNVWQKLDARLDHYNELLRFENINYGLSVAAVLILLVGLFFQAPFQAASLRQNHHQGMRLADIDKVPSTPSAEDKGFLLELSPDKAHIPEEQAQINTISVQKSKSRTRQQPPGLAAQRPQQPRPAQPEEKDAFVEAQNYQGNGSGRGEYTGWMVETIARKPFMEELPSMGVPHDVNSAEKPFVSGIEMLPVWNENRSGNFYPNAYIGIGSAFKLSGLLNSKTWHALERTSLLSSAPSWQQDVYLLYGHKIGNRLYLQADFYLQDKVGQQYNEYREGNYGSFQDVLSYQSTGVNLSWCPKQVGYGKFPVFVRWTGGLYGGRLLSAEEKAFSGTVSRTAEYTRFHAGMLAGYEYDVLLHEQVMLSYGIRSRFDLLNIYSGTEDIPASFRKTRAASLDFSLSLKYLIKK